jgi:hypothetical protein
MRLATSLIGPTKVLWASGGFLLGDLGSRFLALAAGAGLLVGWTAAERGTASAPVLTRRGPAPATPPAPRPELPTAIAGSGYSNTLLFTIFLALAPLLALLLAGSSSRLRLAPAGWRPVPFVSLLERPG